MHVASQTLPASPTATNPMASQSRSKGAHSRKKHQITIPRDNFRIITVQPVEDKEKKKTTLQLSNARREASTIYFDSLDIDTSQATAIQSIYAQNKQYDKHFGTSPEEQVKAAAFMASVGLDISGRELVTNRWSTKWSRESGSGQQTLERVLNQWCVSPLLARLGHTLSRRQ